MLQEQREAEQRRKELAPKPGAKPGAKGKSSAPKKPESVEGANGSEAPKSEVKGGPGSGKNLSRAERIARAKKVSGAQQASKKKKG
jgi:YidC/Oxa1 family membrane protein insertase